MPKGNIKAGFQTARQAIMVSAFLCLSLACPAETARAAVKDENGNINTLSGSGYDLDNSLIDRVTYSFSTGTSTHTGEATLEGTTLTVPEIDILGEDSRKLTYSYTLYFKANDSGYIRQPATISWTTDQGTSNTEFFSTGLKHHTQVVAMQGGNTLGSDTVIGGTLPLMSFYTAAAYNGGVSSCVQVMEPPPPIVISDPTLAEEVPRPITLCAGQQLVIPDPLRSAPGQSLRSLGNVGHRTSINNKIETNYINGLKAMAAQLTASMVAQVKAIGTFQDATQQLTTQRELQILEARAHQAYKPGEQVCQLASMSQGLNETAMKMETNHQIASNLLLQQSTKPAGTPYVTGDMASKMAIDRYLDNHCNKSDKMAGIRKYCRNDDPARADKDVDFAKTITTQKTIKADFTDDTMTPEEIDIQALAENLYPTNLPVLMETNFTGDNLGTARAFHQDIRRMTAARSAILSSYAAELAFRMEGAESSADYIKALYQEMGIPETEIAQITSDKPSYNEQLEALTKTMTQSPYFYINLYENPENNRRTLNALRGIKMMQDREIRASYQRLGQLWGLWLEFKTRNSADNIRLLAGSGETQ